jgi:hypothetical protein
LDWLSAFERRNSSTRFDSTGLSSTRALMNGANAGLIAAPMNAP